MEVVEQPLDFVSELGTLGPQVIDGGTDTADDGFDRVGADHRDALALKGGEDVLDNLVDATVSSLARTYPAPARHSPVEPP